MKLQLIEGGKTDYLKTVGWSPEPSSQASVPSQSSSSSTATTLASVTVRQGQPTPSMIEKNGDIWSCIVCGKIASDPKTKANLKRHTETHIKDIPWPCNICGKVSGSKSGLVQHKAKYHKDLKEDHPVTPRQPLDTSVPYETVINSMIEKQGEVWTCTKCGKSAVDARAKFNLKRHIEVHIEGVAYNCDICGKTSGSKNGLAQHKAKYHRNVVFTSSSTTAASTSALTSTANLSTHLPNLAAHLPTEPIPPDQLPIVAKRSRPTSPTPMIEKKLKLEPVEPGGQVKFKIHRLEEPGNPINVKQLVPVEQVNGAGTSQQVLHTATGQLTPASVQFVPVGSTPTMQFTSPNQVQFTLPPLPQYSTSQYSAAAAQYTAVLNNAVHNSRVQFNFT